LQVKASASTCVVLRNQEARVNALQCYRPLTKNFLHPHPHPNSVDNV
jgi:hypothetical protein